MFKISGNIIDVVSKQIFKGELEIVGEKIQGINRKDVVPDVYIIPGFIDAHIHIESSMVVPSEFSKRALSYGTIAAVSDPHEIANVLGVKGVEFMISNAEKAPVKFYFGAPSCVPATPLETSGASMDHKIIEQLFDENKVMYLSEMMNFPGVIYKDEDVIKKIKIAKKHNVPIDGHAPGLRGKELLKYVQAGISTDHECFSFEEAQEKIIQGMMIQIREGSAAKNFDNLIDLIDDHPDKIMFCSDDLHPDDLLKGHINILVKRAIHKGKDLFSVLRAVTYNVKNHYNLDVGLIQKDDPADFVIVNNLRDFSIREVWIEGKKYFDGHTVLFKTKKEEEINNFQCDYIGEKDIKLKYNKEEKIKVIVAIDGELITNQIDIEPKVSGGYMSSNPDEDILKIIVLNRYKKTKPAIGFVKNFGIKAGAIASSIAHDSHNIIAVGADDRSIVEAINKIIENKGGISAYDGNNVDCLPLPVAGIMSNQGVEEVAYQYEKLTRKAKDMGSSLTAPFMTLSFMALIVIPNLKIGDKGLFDVNEFKFVPIGS